MTVHHSTKQGAEGAFVRAARSAALPRKRREAPPRPTAREALRAGVVKSKGP